MNQSQNTEGLSSRWLINLATRIYDSHLSAVILKTENADKTTSNPIRVVCISDTHNTQPDLPSGDLLLHAGDLSQKGTFEEIQAQLDWLNTQPHHHKVVIGGNHDLLLDAEFVDRFPERLLEREGCARNDLRWGGIIYLNNSDVTLGFGDYDHQTLDTTGEEHAEHIPRYSRRIKIYGSPWTQQYGNWAFQVPPIRDIWTGVIPADTDILLTHGPPKYHLDTPHALGNKFLSKELCRVRPRLVVFGHIHAGYGEENVLFDEIKNLYDDTRGGERKAVLLWWMILKMVWKVTFLRVYSIFIGAVFSTRNKEPQSKLPAITKLVNASAVGGLRSQELRAPIVVNV